MKKIFLFILSHSVFVSLCAAALVVQTFSLIQQPVNWFLAVFVFFATLGSYNLYWFLSKLSTGNQFTIAGVFKQQLSLVMMLVAGLGAVGTYDKTGIGYLPVAFAVFCTLLYAVPFLFQYNSIVRRAGFAKTFLLAFTWMFVTGYIPISELIYPIDNVVQLLLINRFVFMLLLCIIFDNRDIASDKIKGLHSLATDINSVAVRWIVIISFICFFATVYLLRLEGITLLQSVALHISGLLTLATYYYSLKKRGYLFYYFLVDGLMFLSALLTTLASI